MKNRTKRWLSWAVAVVLALALVLGLIPGMSLTAYADDSDVTWKDESGASHTLTYGQDSSNHPTATIDNGTAIVFSDEWSNNIT